MALPTLENLHRAREFGLARYDASRQQGRRHRYGGSQRYTPEELRERDGQSAAAEYLASCLLNRAWLANRLVPDDPKLGDLEGGVQVRWTEYPQGRLAVHETDPEHNSYLLVVEVLPHMRLVGWIPGLEAMAPYWWEVNQDWPAFMVKQHALRPWEELINAVP